MGGGDDSALHAWRPVDSACGLGWRSEKQFGLALAHVGQLSGVTHRDSASRHLEPECGAPSVRRVVARAHCSIHCVGSPPAPR